MATGEGIEAECPEGGRCGECETGERFRCMRANAEALEHMKLQLLGIRRQLRRIVRRRHLDGRPIEATYLANLRAALDGTATFPDFARAAKILRESS